MFQDLYYVPSTKTLYYVLHDSRLGINVAQYIDSLKSGIETIRTTLRESMHDIKIGMTNETMEYEAGTSILYLKVEEAPKEAYLLDIKGIPAFMFQEQRLEVVGSG